MFIHARRGGYSNTPPPLDFLPVRVKWSPLAPPCGNPPNAKRTRQQCIPTATPPQTDEKSDTAEAPQGVWYENWYQNLPEGTKQYQPPPATKALPNTLKGSTRSLAGVKAAALRKQIASYTPMQGGVKNYISLGRTAGGGLRIPKSFVSKWLHKAPGANVLVVGSKGIKPYSADVRTDGSIYIEAERLSGFNRSVFQIRAEVDGNGKHTLIIK